MDTEGNEATISSESAVPIFTADSGSKGGTFILSFGTEEKVGVSLEILAGTGIDDGF